MTLVVIHKPFDLNKVREFYDPHPDFNYKAMGVSKAEEGLLDKVKKVADELSGQKMSAQEAVKKIEAAGAVALVKVHLNECIYHTDKMPDRYDCICMKIFGNDGYNINCTICLIKFR